MFPRERLLLPGAASQKKIQPVTLGANETVWAIVASLHTRHRLHRNQAMSPGCYLIELGKLEIRARKLFVAAIPRLHDLLKSNS